MKMGAEHVSEANIGNTDVLLSTPKYRPTENPKSQVYILKTDFANTVDNRWAPIPSGHINIGPALVGTVTHAKYMNACRLVANFYGQCFNRALNMKYRIMSLSFLVFAEWSYKILSESKIYVWK